MTTAVHHLNCASMAPRLSLGGRMTPRRMVAHCLLVEGPDSLTLVDTGFGTVDLAEKRMGREFVSMMRPALDPAETAVAQVRALGHDPADVTDIVLTHMDLDHAGGLGDFPAATVHVYAEELDAARSPRTLLEKQRYVKAQWAHGPHWQTHEVTGDDWLGFRSVTVLRDDVLMLPLRGHTRGHCGIAVRRPEGGWLLHAGDAYFSADEKQTPRRCPPGLSLFQTLMQVDKPARHDNQARLRSLHVDHGPDSGATDEVTIFCAHDASEYDALETVTD